MWQHWSRFLLLCLALLVATTSACTIPVAPVGEPTPSISQRVLIPTTEPEADIAVTSVATADSQLTSAQAELLAKLPSRGAAPELHNETWLNSEPLQLAELRGKVVIVEFWTYG